MNSFSNFNRKLCHRIKQRAHSSENRLKNRIFLFSVWALSFACFMTFFAKTKNAFLSAYAFNEDLINNVKYTTVAVAEQLWNEMWIYFFIALVSLVVFVYFSIGVFSLIGAILHNKEV